MSDTDGRSLRPGDRGLGRRSTTTQAARATGFERLAASWPVHRRDGDDVALLGLGHPAGQRRRPAAGRRRSDDRHGSHTHVSVDARAVPGLTVPRLATGRRSAAGPFAAARPTRARRPAPHARCSPWSVVGARRACSAGWSPGAGHRPLVQLTAPPRRSASTGRLDVDVPTDGRDETGRLARRSAACSRALGHQRRAAPAGAGRRPRAAHPAHQPAHQRRAAPPLRQPAPTADPRRPSSPTSRARPASSAPGRRAGRSSPPTPRRRARADRRPRHVVDRAARARAPAHRPHGRRHRRRHAVLGGAASPAISPGPSATSSTTRRSSARRPRRSRSPSTAVDGRGPRPRPRHPRGRPPPRVRPLLPFARGPLEAGLGPRPLDRRPDRPRPRGLGHGGQRTRTGERCSPSRSPRRRRLLRLRSDTSDRRRRRRAGLLWGGRWGFDGPGRPH